MLEDAGETATDVEVTRSYKLQPELATVLTAACMALSQQGIDYAVIQEINVINEGGDLNLSNGVLPSLAEVVFINGSGQKGALVITDIGLLPMTQIACSYEIMAYEEVLNVQ